MRRWTGLLLALVLAGALLTGCEEPPPNHLVGAGDIASCGNTNDTRTANLIDDLPGHVVALGDNVYEDGTLQEFRECYAPNWGRHNSRVYPVPGNHEYQDDDAAGYFDYYGSRAGPNRRGYYFFDVGSWRVFALNSEENVSTQANFVRANAGGRRCIAAYWHVPFVSGTHANPDGGVRPLWEAIHDVGADLALGAHDHHYERFAKLGRDGRPSSSGVRLFVVGSGGRSNAGFNHTLPGSEVRQRVYGVIDIELNADSYNWNFHDVNGNITDTGFDACR